MNEDDRVDAVLRDIVVPVERNGNGTPRVLHGDETIEQYLISQWGSEAYFDSAFYKAWLVERQREQKMEAVRAALLKARAA